ncbi:protein of unknown function [Taphrina deformans PYCC 5710]|uniref:MOSC domain-containing protein n=1 Tax=Taphrina deformans (strain PYCC 5710 / ATCC 11124 / CBS 356.35 / IMI 108563 / JCM 9778 / NBRC 8474) TaxID=1097556 RepID=R4XIR4_TAPDE|nr:protein of unknown function [Taphrina deformans PYCC 5710]|eukprot:CCG84389.1 protein of unknown function [Taphrina deformans PYCC 5710]
MSEHSPYNEALEAIRNTEYPQLTSGTCYLDHAGTTIPANSLLKSHLEEIQRTLYGNPHTTSPSSVATTNRIAEVRSALLLELFHDSFYHYDLIFTSGSTAAISLVTQLMTDTYGREWDYQYSINSHTSIIGQRTRTASWKVFYSPQQLMVTPLRPTLTSWPGRSNATGKCEGQHAVLSAHEAHYTLFDASALLPTATLRLDQDSPDFICLSFYKIFGYPSGLGALLIKKSDRITKLVLNYTTFAGGTVEAVSATTKFFAPKRLDTDYHGLLEHGTKAFHSILALSTAMEVHKQLYGSFERIHQHVTYISQYASQRMNTLCHSNGLPLVQLHDYEADSCIMAMTLRRSDHSLVGYADVQAAASVLGIHIRTGTLCNPGITEDLCGITSEELAQNHAAGHTCSDAKDVLNGKATGVVRISFGPMSSITDIDVWVTFLKQYFLEALPSKPLIKDTNSLQANAMELSKIVLYPIKSCAGYHVPYGTAWTVLSHGLEFDRKWAIVSLSNRSVLSQKLVHKMALIRPIIDLQERQMIIMVGHNRIVVSLDPDVSELTELENIKVCGDTITTSIYKDSRLREHLSTFLGVQCTLSILHHGHSTRFVKENSDQSWSGLKARSSSALKLNVLFSNESPFLGITNSSLAVLANKSTTKMIDPQIFRSNFIFSSDDGGSFPFSEDKWTQIVIGDCTFEILGKCRRCQMICINQHTGEKFTEPWRVLHEVRGAQGKLWFGVHMALLSGTQVKVGAPVQIRE